MAMIQLAVLAVMLRVMLKESSWVSGSSDVDEDLGLNNLPVEIFRAKRTTSCADAYSSSTCQSWKNRGWCNQYYYKYHCKRTCGFCSCKNIHRQTSCDNWVIKGFCTSSKYASWMKTNCPMSCGHCHCKDKNNFCSNWAKTGECQRNPRYMLLKCQISCGVCRPKNTKYTTKTPTTFKTTTSTVKRATSKPNDDVIKCGKKALLGRIVGGKKAQAKSWPWQIGIKSCPNCTFFCGGTIVAKKWVITAAHCLVNRRAIDLYIDAGVTDQGKVTKHKQSFKCTAIHSHQSYAINAPFDEDIAVLQLNKEVVFNDHVRPLCLNEKNLKTSQLCSVTGFGRTKENGLSSMSLLMADVPIVAHDVCVKSYKKTRPPRPVTKNMLCAGYSAGGIDACAGDSGGPLTCWDQNKGRYVLGGIVSWGVGCARAKNYGVYTDVEHLTAWITKITGKIQ